MVELDIKAKKEIVDAISEAERRTSAEIRVHLQRKLKKSAFEEAKKTFIRLGMHKTKERNAVLIFVALDSHEFAIIGDSGIHEKVGDVFWQSTRDEMLDFFKNGNVRGAILAGVQHVGQKLAHYFPRQINDQNEVSNKVSQN